MEVRYEKNSRIDDFSISDLIRGVKKRMIYILALSIGFGLFSTAYSIFFITPKYEARGTIIVGRTQAAPNEEIGASDIDLNRRLVGTYTVIMQSRIVQDKV